MIKKLICALLGHDYLQIDKVERWGKFECQRCNKIMEDEIDDN